MTTLRCSQVLAEREVMGNQPLYDYVICLCWEPLIMWKCWTLWGSKTFDMINSWLRTMPTASLRRIHPCSQVLHSAHRLNDFVYCSREMALSLVLRSQNVYKSVHRNWFLNNYVCVMIKCPWLLWNQGWQIMKMNRLT